VPIIVFNPLRERGWSASRRRRSPIEMLTLQFHADRLDLLSGQGRRRRRRAQGHDENVLALDAAARAGGPGVLDRDFHRQHTNGFEALADDLRPRRGRRSSAVGPSRADIEAPHAYANAKRVIVCYGMGITQHSHGTGNVQQIANLLLLRGNIGREGAGICRCAAIPTCRAIAPSASPKSPTTRLLDGIESDLRLRAAARARPRCGRSDQGDP
jgi:hypothetical protein